MKANMDLQFVLNPYDVARYITSYMTKSNNGMSELMRKIKKEHANPNHAADIDSLKSLGDAFVRSRELSVQEACVILLHQQSVYTTRTVEFVNTGDVEFRTEVLKSREELSKLEPGSTEITYSNHRKRYVARPDELNDVCLADWYSMYVPVQYNTPGHDETSDDVPVNPRVYKLKTGGRVRLIADEAHYKVLRYCRFSVNKKPELYSRELVTLFNPFRIDDDSALLLGKQTFVDAYRSVKNIVEKNRRNYERCRTEMEEALEELELENLADANVTLETAARRFAPNITHYDDEDVAAGEEVVAGEVDEELTNLPVVPAAIPESEYFSLIMRLNEDQQLFFYEMLSYERHRLSGFPTQPRFAFLSGGAGTGKSFVLKALHYALSKMAREDDKHLEYDIQKPTVAIGAFCGLAARNVGGSTLHSLLGMAFGVRPSTVDNITHSTLQNYRCALLQLSTILADECSYIGNNFFFCMNERLKRIMCPSKNIPFGGVNVIVFGDLYQLQGVKEGWIFAPIKDYSLPNAEFATSVWTQYEMFELTTIVRQEERSWAELLNRVRVNEPTDEDLTRINRLVGKEVPLLTHRACRKRHNAEVHNERMLATCDDVQIATADDYVKNAEELPRHTVEVLLKLATTLTLAQSQHLPTTLKLAIGQPLMINGNMDKEDGLLNGTIGYLRAVSTANGKIEIIWLDLVDKSAGSATRRKFVMSHPHYTRNGWTPVKRTIKEFPVKSKHFLEGNKSYLIERRQFQVENAQGVTIHKFQGQTVNNIELDFESGRVCHGLVYVGLSRCRTEEGNSLVAPLHRQEIYVDPAVQKEMERLRNKGFTLRLSYPSKSTAMFKLVFHNVQSIRGETDESYSQLRVLLILLLIY